MANSDRQTELCGRCKREQTTAQGDQCILCGRPTLTFNSDYEDFSAAVARWNKLYG